MRGSDKTAHPAHAPDVTFGYGPGGEPGLLLAGSDAAVVLDPTALALWELCDGDTSEREMVDAVLDLYHADAEVVAHDVHKTLERLTDEGLLVWVTSQGQING